MDKPVMYPWPGERLVRFIGDQIRFGLRGPGDKPLPKNFRAILRTNLGRAAALQQETIRAHQGKVPLAGSSWRDVPMRLEQGEWVVDLALTEVGFFSSKAYAIDEAGRQYWPDGENVGVSVHPNDGRTANIIYCAFVRMFGATKAAAATRPNSMDAQLAQLDQMGYAVIPCSGKFRDLIRELPHIFDTLGCRILHLLPVNPTPTTYARMGRFGSPYASLDLMAVDPALVEFDRRTTGIDQFRELAYSVHEKGGRLFLDIVTNHTGWGSPLQENHPEWFLRDGRGNFVSPGAWGVTWEDLVEVDHRRAAPWEHLAEVFLTWCRRGADGFRCDAGYKVPGAAWRYIISTVRQEFPETVFLLEGLGGAWETTEHLLTEGGMQWAYSELFQNYSGGQVAGYLDYAHRQSHRYGIYVHYSETHDNDRLAKGGRTWSLMRNQLCALTSASGAFGFTCGVEWLAAEKILVHGSTGLSWGHPNHLLNELGVLNRLLADHPCFFDGAQLTRLSPPDAPIYLLRRVSSEGADRVVVAINTDAGHDQCMRLDTELARELSELKVDLLQQSPWPLKPEAGGQATLALAAGACCVLAVQAKPAGLSGQAYRRERAAAAWAVKALRVKAAPEELSDFDWRALATRVHANPQAVLGAIACWSSDAASQSLISKLDEIERRAHYPPIVTWRVSDRTRVLIVPPGHWLMVDDGFPFRVTLEEGRGQWRQHESSIEHASGHVACFAPPSHASECRLKIERYGTPDARMEAAVRFLAGEPDFPDLFSNAPAQDFSDAVLLANGRGGMARISVDLGRIKSKYDCLLGANLHPGVPVDRHVFVKRARVWINADGFIWPLDQRNLVDFAPGPPAQWRFCAAAGNGRAVEIHLAADLWDGSNTVALRFSRPKAAPCQGADLPDQFDVRLTVRLDLEDRNFHAETKRNPGTDYHFSSHTKPLPERPGFEFAPASDRRIRAWTDAGRYQHEAEWCENIPHPVEQSRGMTGSGDAYSPGWFDIPLAKGESATLVVSAEPADPGEPEIRLFADRRQALAAGHQLPAQMPETDRFGRQLVEAAHAFVARRDSAKTVIAGYPWFLDWGRDSLISARGLLAAGLVEDVKQLLLTFGRFEQDGTLPNNIHGEDASNRDTSDAPLWYGIVCEELAEQEGASLYGWAVDKQGRKLADILQSIASGYLRGTPNGIRVDPDSGLVWSPKHFTWMDTNFPAGTPRVGYPIEIQVLWIRLLRQLHRLKRKAPSLTWKQWADRAEASLLKFYWMEDRGYLADLLIAESGQPAASATRDDLLRSNYLLAVSLDLLKGKHARRCVDAALRYLVVPGALRSLAPLPASPPLPVHGNDGRLLNHPPEPYWGRYEGDEDTRRKPAYHNGTAWTWTFPAFCEALAKAWDGQPPAVAAAKAYLGSMDQLLKEGCLGQIPEILDGDAPHQQRGCDAQAWGVTEALRVWKWLNFERRLL